MLVLSLECAGHGASACVMRDGVVLDVQSVRMDRGQDARLIPMIQDVLRQSGVGFVDIDRVAVTRGPGSFTGVRIALAAACGIGLAAGKPVFGFDRFSVFQSMHRRDPAHKDRDLFVVLDSKRAELFCRLFAKDGRVTQDMLLLDDIFKIRDVVVRGDAFSLLGAPWGADIFFVPVPDLEAEVVETARLGSDPCLSHEHYPATPLYLRQPDVTYARQGCA